MSDLIEDRLNKLERLVADLRQEIDELRAKPKSETGKSNGYALSGRLKNYLSRTDTSEIRSDQNMMSINLGNRLENVERKILKRGPKEQVELTEVFAIRNSISSLYEFVMDGEDRVEDFDKLNERVIKLEQELAT